MCQVMKLVDPVHGREQWKLRAIEVLVIVPIRFESSN